MADAAALLAEARAGTDAALAAWAERLRVEIGGRRGAALEYALRTPGKRVRAALVLAAYRSTGGTDPAAAEVAAAVDPVHAYSFPSSALLFRGRSRLGRLWREAR